MKKLSIKMKILMPTLILVLVGFTVLTVVIMVQYSNTSQQLQEVYVKELAYHNVYQVKAVLEAPLDEARALALFLGETIETNAVSREMVVSMLDEWLGENDEYFGVYT